MNELANKFLGDSDRASRLYFSKLMEPYGLDGSRFIFFMSVYRNPGITQAGITKITMFEKSVVARAIASLVKDGYIERIPAVDDRRTFRLCATPKGTEIYQHVIKIVEGWNNKLYAHLSYPKKDILEMLGAINTASRQILMEEFQLDHSEN